MGVIVKCTFYGPWCINLPPAWQSLTLGVWRITVAVNMTYLLCKRPER